MCMGVCSESMFLVMAYLYSSAPVSSRESTAATGEGNLPCSMSGAKLWRAAVLHNVTELAKL